MFQKCVSQCVDTKDFLQLSFEAWVFVDRNIQQNQADSILLHVGGNKLSY